MGQVAAMLRKDKNEFKLLLLGLDNAGKTSILKKMANEQIAHIMPTQGFNIKSIEKDGIKFKMWDLGGQRAIRPFWENYYKGAGAIVFVVDSTDHRRFNEAAKELKMLMDEIRLVGIP